MERRTFLIGLCSLVAAPVLPEIIGSVCAAPLVSEAMAFRSVFEMNFACVREDGLMPESRHVGFSISRRGSDTPFFRHDMNQRGVLNWGSRGNPMEELVFLPSSPMVIVCDPPPVGTNAVIQTFFRTADGKSYMEELTWRERENILVVTGMECLST